MLAGCSDVVSVDAVWLKWHCYRGRFDCRNCRMINCAPLQYIDGLVQDCSISSALAMETLQSCTKPSIQGCNLTSFLFYLDGRDIGMMVLSFHLFSQEERLRRVSMTSCMLDAMMRMGPPYVPSRDMWDVSAHFVPVCKQWPWGDLIEIFYK